MGTMEEGQKMLGSHQMVDTLQISDPSCRLYRAYELDRGSLSQLFGMEVWWAGFKAALVQRHGLGKLAGDGFQLGGAFLIRDDKIIESHRSTSAADATPFCKLNLTRPQL